MLEALLYIATAFWSGATHAATPGHGKTIAAAYLVGARGRIVDAIVLGIVVTLAHTAGIVVFAILAVAGASQLPLHAEGYLSLATSLLVVGIGLWMLGANRATISSVGRGEPIAGNEDPSARDRLHPHPHDHPHPHPHDPPLEAAPDFEHRDAWGRRHSHTVALPAVQRPSLGLLLGLGLAGGILPDPALLCFCRRSRPAN